MKFTTTTKLALTIALLAVSSSSLTAGLFLFKNDESGFLTAAGASLSPVDSFEDLPGGTNYSSPLIRAGYSITSSNPAFNAFRSVTNIGNTDGVRSVFVRHLSGGQVQFLFDAPINFLRFDLHDASNLGGSATYTLDNSPALTGTLFAPSEFASGQSVAFGIVNDDTAFSSFTINATGPNDFYRIDSVAFGSNEEVAVPEPATIGAASIALVASMLFLRKRLLRSKK